MHCRGGFVHGWESRSALISCWGNEYATVERGGCGNKGDVHRAFPLSMIQCLRINCYDFLDLPELSVHKRQMQYEPQGGYGARYRWVQNGIDLGGKMFLAGQRDRLPDGGLANDLLRVMCDTDKLPVQMSGMNMLGGCGKTYQSYGLNGQVLLKLLEQSAASGNLAVYCRYTYDHA